MLGTMLIIIGVQFLFFGLLAEMIAFSWRRDNDYSVIERIEAEERPSPAQAEAAVEG